MSDTPPAVRPKSAYVNVSVWDLVVGDMRKRDRSGRQKYGCPVQPFNGRNAIRDAYEECLDMAVYLRQEMLQRDLTRAATLEDVARLAEEHGLPSAYVAALRRQAEDLKREIQSVDQMS